MKDINQEIIKFEEAVLNHFFKEANLQEFDVEFDVDRFVVKGAPEKFKTMKEVAFAAYNQAIPGLEPGLEAVSYYDPPNMTYPFGAYVCVMDIDVDTGVVDIRRFYELYDCGTRINPMIIEGQIHGGLTEALAVSLGQEIAYDDMGNVKTGTLETIKTKIPESIFGATKNSTYNGIT